jgi:flagellar motor switch protein FliG
VLRKALGDDKANLLIDRILQGNDVTGIESLKWMDPGSVAELLRNEHPQIVAAILVHLDSTRPAEVLKLFTERQRNEVMVRIATLDGIQPGAEGPERGDEQGAGRRRPHEEEHAGRREDGGRDPEHAGQRGRDQRAGLRARGRPDLAQKIMDNMFTFDDLEKIDDKGIQAAAEGSAERIAGAGAQGRHAGAAREGLPNMSSARRRDAARRPRIARPGALSEVEAEQKEMLKIVRRLVDEGQIVLAGGGDDDFV